MVHILHIDFNQKLILMICQVQDKKGNSLDISSIIIFNNTLI